MYVVFIPIISPGPILTILYVYRAFVETCCMLRWYSFLSPIMQAWTRWYVMLLVKLKLHLWS